MPMKKYTEGHYQFLKDNVKGRTTYELTEMFNKHFDTTTTRGQIRAYLKNHDLKSDIDRKKLAQFIPRMFSPEQIKFIEEHVKGVRNKDLAELLNKEFGLKLTDRQINTYKKNHGLISGLDNTFKPGHIPANKGMKGVGGWEPTQFKKGHKPYNYMPVGSERVNTDGYVDIKIAEPNKWKAKHRIMWEEAYGAVPKGCRLIFGDGNKLNVSLDNLILVSQTQLAILNRKGLIQKDADLTRSAIIMADIYHKISERKKK